MQAAFLDYCFITILMANTSFLQAEAFTVFGSAFWLEYIYRGEIWKIV